MDPDVFRSTPEELKYSETFLGKAWYPSVAGVLGFVTACGMNFLAKRPPFAGIQKHVGMTAAGGAIGYWVMLRKEKMTAQRDAIFHHYMSLHPEDFPVVEKKKYKDLLLPWIPIR